MFVMNRLGFDYHPMEMTICQVKRFTNVWILRYLIHLVSIKPTLHKQIDKHRWNVLVCHRRFGKTVCILNHLIRSALLLRTRTQDLPTLHQHLNNQKLLLGIT